jgi:hypothetical protein
MLFKTPSARPATLLAWAVVLMTLMTAPLRGTPVFPSVKIGDAFSGKFSIDLPGVAYDYSGAVFGTITVSFDGYTLSSPIEFVSVRDFPPGLGYWVIPHGTTGFYAGVALYGNQTNIPYPDPFANYYTETSAEWGYSTRTEESAFAGHLQSFQTNDGHNFTFGGTVDYVDPLHLLPPVPEPSTWAMLLIGFAAIGFAGYRAKGFTIAPRDRHPGSQYLRPTLPCS